MIIEAATRLHAVKADYKQAFTFLTELGFDGLTLKDSEDDMIKFHYVKYDKATVAKYLGEPTVATNSLRYNYSTHGVVAIWVKNKVVVLKNATRMTTRLKPTETHVPVVETEVEDDKNVPITHISKELEQLYLTMTQTNSPMARLLFNKKLWLYLNEHKFSSKMTLPKLGLLKNQGPKSFRLRGRWWASKRLLEVSPRLYNASQNFFVETFLHEMAHQAVSEIDRYHEKEAKGHGPHWARWMRQVGLNPLRFDPNDNTVYMDKDEKIQHEKELVERKARNSNLAEQAKELGIRQTVPHPNQFTYIPLNGGFVSGLVLFPLTKSGTKWLFMTETDINLALAGKAIRWFTVSPGHVYNNPKRSVITPEVIQLIEKVRIYLANKDKLKRMYKNVA